MAHRWSPRHVREAHAVGGGVREEPDSTLPEPRWVPLQELVRTADDRVLLAAVSSGPDEHVARLQVVEDDDVVEVHLWLSHTQAYLDHTRTLGSYVENAIGVTRTVRVHLRRPLGARQVQADLTDLGREMLRADESE